MPVGSELEAQRSPGYVRRRYQQQTDGRLKRVILMDYSVDGLSTGAVQGSGGMGFSRAT